MSLGVVSFWEVMPKVIGKLKVGDPPRVVDDGVWWMDALEQLAATPLPLRPRFPGRGVQYLLKY